MADASHAAARCGRVCGIAEIGVATNRFDLLQGPDAANNGLNDFLARHLFAFAVDGRVVS